jgi:putative pyruvate formate lyase activating enzyme
VRFLSEEISSNTYLDVMAQYRPEYNASRFPELNRPITGQEYADALRLAERAGLARTLAML